MVHEAHAETHDNPGILGGLADGSAIGLGIGMLVGGLLALRGVINVPAWGGLVAVTASIGATLGSMWGKNRGY